MEKKKESKTIINNWGLGDMFRYMNINKLFKWAIVLILVSSLVGLSTSLVTENKEVYNICMGGCQSDLKIAKLSYDFENPPNKHKTNIVINRVGCIKECNGLYLTLRGR